MKLQYEREKGSRIKRRHFFGVNCREYGYSYYKELDKWLYIDDPNGKGKSCCTSHLPFYKVRAPRTVKAFKKYMRKHSKYLPEGIEFCLESIYIGDNVYGRIPKY